MRRYANAQTMINPKLRRDVFYFHGFDRRGPRFFNLLQKRQAKRYSNLHGTEITVGKQENSHWNVSGGLVETRFHFMDWSDIVSERMNQPFWVGVITMFKLLISGLRQSIYGRVYRCDWGLGALLIWGSAPMILWLLILTLSAFAGLSAVIWVFAIGLGVFWLMHRFDHYLGLFYIAHIGWGARHIAKRSLPELERRLKIFEAQVEGSDADEIVIVGHSIGAALAVLIAAQCPKASLLTVGQSIPLMSLQKEAQSLRDALDRLKEDERVWIDVSAGRDLLGFRAYDPSKGGAKCVSANFKKSFGTDVADALKWKGFEMHFLYFRPVQNLGPWDWFGILAGRSSLIERFAKQPRNSGLGERRTLF